MRKGTGFILVVATVVAGYAAGRYFKKEGPAPAGPTAVKEPGAAVPGDVERKQVALEGPAKGAPDALVNIVEFSDFQCPFCSRVVPTIERLTKEYPKDLRVFFRHYPLPFHQNAPLAAQAAAAANAQGKFWQMHDKLFANQQALTRPDLEKYAGEIGLDVAKFKAGLDAGTYKSVVDQDMAAAGKLGVQGTPNFFINGRPLAGAYPYEEFKKIVDDEIARTKKLMASGTPRSKVYDKLMAGAGSGAVAAKNNAKADDAPAGAAEVFKVPVGDSAAKGGKEPKVTIVEFSDFQCPFCGRVTGTLKQIEDSYKNDVQLVFKELPLPMHQNAEIAAQAGEAAKAQGKFWQMHDKMFANQQALTRPDLEKYAGEIGLDVGKFKAFLDSGKGKKQIEDDKALAGKVGARGTPTFFINGRIFMGAQPFEAFKKVIDEEMKKADEALKGGTPRRDLYAALIKNGKEGATPPPSKPTAAPGEPSAGTAYKAEIKGAPMKGAVKDALVTIVQYSDFQCPFCSRVEPTIAKVMDEYKGKVRVAWRDYPLPFHPNAMPAAMAARAAGEQGKFWEMHDKLFANQQSLDAATYEKYAQELGLNLPKFKKAIESKAYEPAIKADMAMGAQIGVQGTPAFFINGSFLSGAQPFEAFKARIDQELAKAEELVKKGTPKAKVYDAIMKGAQDKVAAAPAAGGDSPAADDKVVQVELGKAPVKGPKNAPITLVVFSDFQCPFCSRVEPTLDEVEKLYPGKIRRAWKNYPLPFHQNARPAALAALAAGEQGKFWEMHDKLFANQQALDATSLEKYAQELKLDLAKFKKAMDDKSLAAQIDEDMKQGQQVGVSGTPATFVNGHLVSGAVPIDEFKKIIDQELAKGGAVAEKGRGRKRS